MFLLIDQGNTRLKWRVTDERGGLVREGVNVNGDWSGVSALAQSFGGVITKAFVSSVRNVEEQSILSAWVMDQLCVETVFAKVESKFLGFVPAYSDVNALGVDRWLAMLAAFHESEGDCVIVSAGTALTVDYLKCGGEHLGGMIFPGYRLLCDSMGEKSEALKVGGVALRQGWAPGSDTVSCIAAGLVAALSGLMEQVEDYALEKMQSPKFFLTGGDSGLIEKYLSSSAEVRPGLVLDGLSLLYKI